ncbi:Fanconi anemia core complex-associated protein 100 isoform X1 [Phyllopteryx taeniolatus]|uniref:Fanconi anemia core complex-associated protein 100 isoform X1 n=1 Tax=Phyllopteryx taeniolatus TaxID=161469 RepID=UPI002AD4B5E4|nr:Fanconi anemia core complex-associated protein 100 isoform X1 [Phyllopteryx taeniolatus]
MEGRCVVETLTEFGFSSESCSLRVGADVFLSTGSDEVYVFSDQNRELKAIILFPGPVRDLVVNEDKQTLYVACCSGVYCIGLSSLPSRVQSSRPSSIVPHMKISGEHLVIREEGVLALLLVNSVLLNLRLTKTSWLLTRYKIAEESILGSYERLGSFNAPVVSDSGHHITDERSERRPVLFCVHSAAAPSSSSLPSGHVCLEPVLFKVLFGIDAALAKSPVIFCGLLDGRLCFAAQRLPGSQLRVLHSLEQPVVFVGASAGTRTDPAECLVALGEQGKVVLVTSKQAGPEGGGIVAAFTEVCVPGPVVCACLDKRCLYYSTGSDLLVLDLSQASTGGSEAAMGQAGSQKSASAPQNVISLNVCRVIALTKHAWNTDGRVQLLGLSCRGQLQRISLPVGLQDGGSSQPPSSHVGRSIRDVLSAIGDVYERSSVLKASIKSRNQTLKHLNQVLNISFLLNTEADGRTLAPVQDKPIRCHATTSWSTLLQKDSLNLKCVLDNGSSYVLERGWTLNITAFPMCDSPEGESCSKHYSFPFHNLHPGEKLEISVPLATAGDLSVPCSVSCSLTFSFSGLLGEEAVTELPQGGLVSLPLNTLMVDWLHVLRVLSPADAKRNATSQPYDVTVADTIRAFLKSRCGVERDAGNEQHSATIKVSSQLLRDMLKPSEGGPEESEAVSPNVCISLLDWLLCEGHGGVKMQGDKMALTSPVVHARAPNGHTIKLTAKEVNLAQDRAVEREEPLVIVEVQIESSSLADVCGMHHAVLRRVQNLLQKAPDKPSSTIQMQSLCVREALQRAEKLLRQLQQSRISCTFGEGVSMGKVTSCLLNVYEELRGNENSLLII